MSCIDCDNKFESGSTVYINQPQEPFCEQCGDDSVCLETIDSKCVVYHSDNVAPSKLQNLGLPNRSTAETIFEKIDDLIGNNFNVPITIVPSESVLLTVSGASSHSLKADAILSPDAGNILQVKNNGLYATSAQDYKVKVNAADQPDYLENQIIGGTDSIVSISSFVFGGQVKLLPALDLTALIIQLCQRPAFFNCIIDNICSNDEFIACFLNNIAVKTELFTQFCNLVSGCKCGFNVTGLARVYAQACPSGYVLTGANCVRTESIAATVSNDTVDVCSATNSAYSNYSSIVYVDGYTNDGRGIGASVIADVADGHVVQLPSPPSHIWNNPTASPTEGPMNRASVWGCDGTNTGTPYGFSIPITVPSTKTYYIGIGGDDEYQIKVNGTTLLNTQAVSTPTHQAYYADVACNFKYWHIYPVTLTAGVNFIAISGVDTAGVAAAFAAEIYDNTLSELQSAALDPAYVSSPLTFPLTQNHYSNLNLLFSTRCAKQPGSSFSVGNASCPDSTWSLDTTGSGSLASPCQGINNTTAQWTCKRITTTSFTGYSVTVSWDRADGALNYEVEYKPTSSPDSAYVAAPSSPVSQTSSGIDPETIISGLPNQTYTFRVRTNYGDCLSDWEVL